MKRWGSFESLVTEIRQQQPPDLPYSRLRARLVDEMRRAHAGAAAGGTGARGRQRWLPALAFAALALSALVWQLGENGVRQPGEAASAVPAATPPALSPQWLDSASFEAGDRVAAVGHDVTVEHAGRARWSLAAGSSARVLSLAGEVRLELEAGSLAVTVFPHRPQAPRASSDEAAPERHDFFVVQAFGTEVSVHGTRFRVRAARLGLDPSLAPSAASHEPVTVEVDEGVVRVRPLGEQGGIELAAGSRAEFVAGKLVGGSVAPSTAGTSVREPGAGPPNTPSAPRDARAAQPSANKPGVRAGNTAPAPEATLRPEPSASLAAGGEPGVSAAAVETAAPAQAVVSKSASAKAHPGEAPPAATSVPDPEALAVVIARIRACFHRYTRDRGDVRIQAFSRLELDVLPDGRVLSLELDPPLSPDTEQCADAAISSLHFKASASGYRIERTIQLSTE